MSFKYSNLLYKLSFDGMILKYQMRPLLRFLLLRSITATTLEFCVRDISKYRSKGFHPLMKGYKLELSQWNTAINSFTQRNIPTIYLLNLSKKHISALNTIVELELSLDKSKPNWFLPRDYGRMVG